MSNGRLALIVIFFALLFSSASLAQPRSYCGTEQFDVTWLREFVNTKLQESISRNCDIYVPLTVHILGDDDGNGYHPFSIVFNSLLTLNEDFESTGIKFYLASPFNYIDNSSWYEHTSFNIGAQMMNFNNVPNTINCYIVDNAADNCGYRSFNGNALALSKSCTQADDHTWAHEMGHYLSLPHTFRGWEGTTYDDTEETPNTVGGSNVELLDGTNCDKSGDFFCDTAPDYISYRWDCDPNFESKDSLSDPMGQKFKADGTLIMSYAFDDCQSRFSHEQRVTMCEYLDDRRPDLISSATPLDPIDISNTLLLSPRDGEIVDNDVTLKWQENGSATFYIVELSRFPNMGILSLREVVYGTSLDVIGLTDDKKYYWRVRALNEYDFNYIENKTPTESFETGNLSSTEEFYAKNLKIYPNPLTNSEDLKIELDSPSSEEVLFTLFTSSGLKAYSNRNFIKNGTNSLTIPTAHLAKGIYFLTGRGNNHNFQRKIVLE